MISTLKNRSSKLIDGADGIFICLLTNLTSFPHITRDITTWTEILSTTIYAYTNAFILRLYSSIHLLAHSIVPKNKVKAQSLQVNFMMMATMTTGSRCKALSLNEWRTWLHLLRFDQFQLEINPYAGLRCENFWMTQCHALHNRGVVALKFLALEFDHD